MSKLPFLSIAIAALAACGDNLAPPPPLPGGSSTRTIKGRASLVTIDEQGQRTIFPIGLHDTLVTAQFPDGDGWDVREGTTSADGTFTIEDAPDGDYWLDVDDVPTGNRQLLWTNATPLVFEERANGRGDATIAGPSTTLTFDLDGVDPAEAEDGLQLASGNLGLIANVLGALQPGDIAVHTTRSWVGAPLISAAAHDQLTVAQTRVLVDATGLATTQIVKAVTFDDIEQVDRADTRVTGSFTTPPALPFDLRWKRAAFAAAAADIRPTGVGPVEAELFSLRAMPGGTANGTSPLAPIVLAIDSPMTDTTDLDLPFSLPNPYPQSWLFADYQMLFPVDIAAPGDPSSIAEFSAVMEVITNELPDGEHPIVPLVTPARQPTIDGMDLYADHDGVGLTPMIAWSPPAQGTPTAYVIRVLRWLIQPGASAPIGVATLVVPGDVTAVRMPGRILEPGEHYLLDVVAISQARQDVRVHSLYTPAIPYGTAESFTNTFSP